MIKNLLYSLFLHFLLLLVIYLNFNLQKIDEQKTSEIAVSLVTLTGEEKASTPTKESSKQSEEAKKEDDGIKKVEENKEAESPKISEQNKVKKTPKKIAKTKSAKAIKKITPREKIDEFKPEEKEEVKQKDAKKPQEDPTQNQNEDEEQNEAQKKEDDQGAKKESVAENEEKKQENPKNLNVNEMANSLESLDLSTREKFNIQSQLKYCYHMAIKESKFEAQMKIASKVQISRDGKITFDIDQSVDKNRYDNPSETEYRNMISNIERALDLCSPLRNLPLDKYDIWKEVVLEFGE
jgi:outer membrane biosynthesis protein TonB